MAQGGYLGAQKGDVRPLEGHPESLGGQSGPWEHQYGQQRSRLGPPSVRLCAGSDRLFWARLLQHSGKAQLGVQGDHLVALEVTRGLSGITRGLSGVTRGLSGVTWRLREVTWGLRDVTRGLREVTWGLREVT